MERVCKTVWLFVCLSALMPSLAFAQATITGVVRDASGGVLPGVTVEASSPVLIEKARSVVTDGSGQYRIIDLRPGTYSVSFTLPGFSTVKRDGVELQGTFVAQLSVDMRVGALEETITVTGEAPVVDVSSTTQEHVLSKEILDSIPSGRMQNNLAVLITGVTSNMKDVGGSNFGELTPQLGIHGSRAGDSRFQVDGLSPKSAEGSGQYSAYMPNMSSSQEVTITTSGGSAESQTGGIVMNLVPREGGNTFSGTFFAGGSNDSMVASNFTQDLKDKGLTAPNTLDYTYDVNPGFGGPILRDKLWFFTAFRWNGNQSKVAGMFYNLNEGNLNSWTYSPDLSRQAENGGYFRSANARLTWQANQKNKFSIFYDDQTRCSCPNYVSTQSPEFGEKEYGFPMNRFATAAWTSPLTNKLLLSAGYADHAEVWTSSPPSLYRTDIIGVSDQATGISFRGSPLSFRRYFAHLGDLRASVTYVTGSHEAKFGLTNSTAFRDDRTTPNDSGMTYRLNNGIPNQVNLTSAPFSNLNNTDYDLGVYAQDRWIVKRLTLNLGVRFDMYGSSFPEQTLGPSKFTPNRNFVFPAEDFINWKDITPRMAAAYDVFGDGKTAVKVVLNKYVQGQTLSGGFGSANPVQRTSLTVNRSWNDLLFPVGDPRRGNYVPDCDLTNVVANAECGAASDQNFGRQIASTTIDPDTYRGWGKRQYNWEFSTSVAREIIPRVSADVAYFRRSYGNFLVTDNRAVTAADFSQFSVVLPTDSRLPDGGGQTVSGFYNVNPNRFGQTDNYQTFASNYGEQSETWTGIDFNLRARLGAGTVVQGGTSTGHQVTDTCGLVAALPETAVLTAPYCHANRGYTTQIKALGTYTVPRVDVQLAATFQSLPGPALSANVTFANAVIQPSLGRPLAGGAANVSINALAPGKMYGERMNQLDLRFGKIFRFDRYRANVGMDLFNVMNANPVLTENSTYNPQNLTLWRTPQSILIGRYVRFSMQFDF